MINVSDRRHSVRAPDLTPQREGPPELDTNDEPGLGAPARMRNHAQDAVDADGGKFTRHGRSV
jgi:hypothetical protein